MKNSEQNTRGFTLVEVLVAMAVFSILMLTLFSSFNAFTVSGQRIMDQEQNRQEKGLGCQIMMDDLEQVFILQPPRFQKNDFFDIEMDEKFEFIGTRTREKDGDFSRLSFACLTQVRSRTTGPEDSGISRLTYYVKDHGGRLDLHRSDRSLFSHEDETDQNPCSDPVMFMDIREFDLVFFDREGNETDAWNSMDEDHMFSFPAQVGILVILNRGGRQIRIKTTAPLLVHRTVDK